MQGPPYSSDGGDLFRDPSNPVGYGISILQATGTIICITDPSGADIYIDNVLQSVKTSTSLIVPTGNRTVTFKKAGYASYSEIVAGLKKNQVVKVCAILGQVSSITNYGIVICTGPNISSCPMAPVPCPISINPLDYVNFIAIINSTVQTQLTVTFTYTLNGTEYMVNVPIVASEGTNIVYAFPENIRYSPNTVMTLVSVDLTSTLSGEGDGDEEDGEDEEED